MLINEYSLRPMVAADLVQVLGWRNHRNVRSYMYSTQEIGFDEHCVWFENSKNNPKVDLLIYEEMGKSKGFVKITRTRCTEVAEWGFYLAPNAQKGSGRMLGMQALHYAFVKLSLYKVCGQALEFNKSSIAFHKRLGFTEEGRLRNHHFDGTQFHDVLCFGLLGNEWKAELKD